MPYLSYFSLIILKMMMSQIECEQSAFSNVMNNISGINPKLKLIVVKFVKCMPLSY